MPIDTEQWRACIGLFCASRVLLQPPRCKQPQPKVQADTLSLNMRLALAVLLVTLRTGIFYLFRILQLLWLITYHASWLLSSIVKGSCRRLRGVSVLLALCLVVVPMLLIMSGDVEENPGPPKIQTTFLGVNDLRCVSNELLDVSHKWFRLGLELQLRVGTLECVKKDQYQDSSAALLDMLLHWLKKVDPPPTWERLACALESRAVGEPQRAEQLRTKFCKTEGVAVSPVFDSAMSDSIECRAFRTCFKNLVGGISNPRLLAVSLYSEDIISSTTRAEVTSTSLSLPDRVLKLLDAVECQIERNPDAFFSFVDVLREDRSHVYLADFLVSVYRSPRKRKREQTQAQLFDIPGENWEITDKFSVALDTIKDNLAVESPKLKAYLCFLSHPLKPDEPYIPLRHYESATTTSEIIRSLFPKFINYQNTGLLKQIVLRFGCDKSKTALQEYLQHYSKFTDKKLSNMPKAVSEEELDRATGVKKLRIETNMTLDKATIADTEIVQNGLAQATGIDPCFISPAQHDPGSVILTFLVPESVCEIFSELCEEDLEILANCGITKLQIEDCVIANVREYCTNVDEAKEQSLFIDDPGITAKGLDIVLLLKQKVLQCTQYAHLVNLLAAVPQQHMHRVCSDEFLQQLALTFGNWIELAPYLGITGSTVQQIALQYHSKEEQSYRALLQWKELFQESATHEGLVEFLVRHTSLSTVEAALNIISPANLVQKTRRVLQQAYLSPRSGCLWPRAPSIMEFSQRLGLCLKSDLDSDFDCLAFDYSSHIENFPAAVKVVSVKSFLNAVSQKQQRLFMLSGPHGSGKTGLLRKACSLWAQGLCWRKFTLVLWLDMKALATALDTDTHKYSFMKFLQFVVPEGVDLGGICEWVGMHNGRGVLLVLDGIDPSTDIFLYEILHEIMLEEGSIIVTSSSSHHLFLMKYSRYSLLGLSEDQITRQVISYYSDSPQKGEDFFTFISATPAIRTLCSNPPCLVAVLSVFDSGYPNDLPATWTQLFEHLVHLFIKQCPNLDQPSVDLPILSQLAQWTYYGTVYYSGVVREPLKQFFNTVTPPYVMSVKPAIVYFDFSLPWLTCSYFTAVHIHTLPLEDQAALMKGQRVHHNVWQFFAGLCTSVDTLNHVLTNYCHRDSIKSATCLHEAGNIGLQKEEMQELTVKKTLMTAYETHIMLSVAQKSTTSCKVAVKTRFLETGVLAEIGKCLTAVSILGIGGIGDLNLSGETDAHLSLQEVRVLARGVAISSTLKTLIINLTGIPDAGISALAGAVRVNQHLEKLVLGLTGLSAEGISALASALCVNHSLKELNLSLTGIPDAGISVLAEALRVNQSLEKLDLGVTGLSAEGASALASALCDNHRLKELNLRDTGLAGESASALASALCGKYSLKVLDLSGSKITDAGVSALAGVLRVHQSLEKLDLSNTGLSVQGASALASALCVNHSLKVLNLASTVLSTEGSSALASALHVNHSLKELDLSLTGIPDAGISALAEALMVNQTLEKLDLRDIGLSAKAASALASALCVNHSLKVLNFFGNVIPHAGVSSLAGALMVNQSLEELDLRYTGLSAEGTIRLASALCVNSSLKVLNLFGNKIPDAGVSALAGAVRVNQSLEKLYLRCTRLSTDEASAMANALRINHSLKVLNISLNDTTDRGVSALAYGLEVNNSLRKLYLSGVSRGMEKRLRGIAKRKGIDMNIVFKLY